jgi:hypothetical protein
LGGEVFFRNLKKSVLKKIALAAGAVVLVGVLGIAIAALEPFAERFEGKTVRQWVRYYADRAHVDPGTIGYMRGTNSLVEARVIGGFGTNALKGLIAVHKGSSLFYLGFRIEMVLANVEQWRNYRDWERKMDAIAMLWASEWAEKNEEELARMLKTNKDDEFVRAVFDVSVDPLTGLGSLDEFRKHPDIAVRERAMKMQMR